MKKLYFLLMAFCLFTSANSQIINFPDANFKAKLLAASQYNDIAHNLSDVSFKIDANNDGQIQFSEALNVGKLYVGYSNISDLSGFEYFTNLTLLDCTSNNISTLDPSPLNNLYEFYVSQNQLTNLNISSI